MSSSDIFASFLRYRLEKKAFKKKKKYPVIFYYFDLDGSETRFREELIIPGFYDFLEIMRWRSTGDTSL